MATSGDPGMASAATLPVQDTPLAIIDQGIVLALCLDVKNHNPLVSAAS